MPETLRQLVSRGPVDPSTALSILGQLLNALEFAHWRGVVYGDIAPEGIVLTSNGEATVAEFSITRAGEDPAPTQADTVISTAGYLAPEQVNGDQADERTDIFAMGAVAYEMLTGRHPFGASDGLCASYVMHNIVHKAPLEIPQAILDDLPRHIPPVLDVALAKDPKDRFPNAISFLDALKGTNAAADVVAPSKTAPPRTAERRTSRSRRKWPVYSAVAALVVAALVVLLVLILGGESGSGSAATTTSGGTTSTERSVRATATTTTTAVPSTTTTTSTITTTTIATTTTTNAITTTTTAIPIRSEQTESLLAYTGAWSTTTNGSASGGNFLFANSSGASVTVTFEGTYLVWIAKKSPVYGKAELTLDDQAPVIVDLYSATTLWQEKAWDTGALPFGAHTLTIAWTGAKNSSATDYNISVDAFDIVGSLSQVP